MCAGGLDQQKYVIRKSLKYNFYILCAVFHCNILISYLFILSKYHFCDTRHYKIDSNMNLSTFILNTSELIM